MNNKGFVVSAVLYPLLVLFLALIMGLISMMGTRKNILDNLKMEISDSIFDSVVCNCEVINSTLKKHSEKITNLETFVGIEKKDDDEIISLDERITNVENRINILSKQELTIYMSPTGNDSNDGLSSDKPMKTINSVLDKYSNNNLQVYLTPGTYDWGNVKIESRSISIIGTNSDGEYGDISSEEGGSCGGNSNDDNCSTKINMATFLIETSSVNMEHLSIRIVGRIEQPGYSKLGNVNSHMIVKKSNLSLDDIFISNNSDGPYARSTLYSFGSNVVGYDVSILAAGKGINIFSKSDNTGNALAVAGMSYINMERSYLSSTNATVQKLFATLAVADGSTVYLGYSRIFATNNSSTPTDTYYVYRESGSVVLDYLLEKTGQKSGTVTISN